MKKNKPYASSCDENKFFILQELKNIFFDSKIILEIGSGTGQHAVFFGKYLPHARWLTSDVKENHAGILQWISEANVSNVEEPIYLDVSTVNWSTIEKADAVFSANTAHIMHAEDVENFFKGVGTVLTNAGYFCLYGPFNYNGDYTSQSNADFDKWLKARDKKSGIKDMEYLNTLANDAGMILHADIELPANNRILVWKKTSEDH